VLGLLILVFLFGKALEDAMSYPFSEKIKTNRDGYSNEISELMQRIRRINIIRYSLRLVVILWVAYMLFGQPKLSWIILFALVFLMSILDKMWRKLIRGGTKALS